MVDESVAYVGQKSHFVRVVKRRWWMMLAGIILGSLIAQLAWPIESDGIAGVGLGGLIGLATAFAAALTFERSLDRIDDAADVATKLALPVLAQLTREAVRSGNPVLAADSDSSDAHSFRRIAASILASTSESSVIRALVTSPDLSSAHAMVSINLALAFEEAGHKVVLVSGDRRRTDIDAVFSLEGRPGLHHVLEGDSEVALAEVKPRLRVLPSGMGEVRNFLNEDVDERGVSVADPLPSRSRVGAVMSAASDWAEVVVVDAPPALAFGDAQMFAAHCDVVVLTLTTGITTAVQVEQVQTMMGVVGTEIIGCVLLQRGELRAARLEI